MYAEGGGVTETAPESAPRQETAADATPLPEGELAQSTSPRSNGAPPEMSLDQLRTQFAELKREVDALKQSSLEELPARSRGISLRILELDEMAVRVLNEGEIEELKQRLVKVQRALELERHRSFSLEQQLQKQSQQEDNETTARTRLNQVMPQLRAEYEELQTEMTQLQQDKDQKDEEWQSMRVFLDKSNMALVKAHQSYQTNIDELEKKAHAAELKLKVEHALREKAQEKAAHLEKLVLKMSEDNKTAENSETVEEAPTIPASASVKQNTTFPDPPSEEGSPTERRGSIPLAEPLLGVLPPEGSLEGSPVVEEATQRPEDSGDNGWKWNVSGIWGYVTGEPADGAMQR